MNSRSKKIKRKRMSSKKFGGSFSFLRDPKIVSNYLKRGTLNINKRTSKILGDWVYDPISKTWIFLKNGASDLYSMMFNEQRESTNYPMYNNIDHMIQSLRNDSTDSNYSTDSNDSTDSTDSTDSNLSIQSNRYSGNNSNELKQIVRPSTRFSQKLHSNSSGSSSTSSINPPYVRPHDLKNITAISISINNLRHNIIVYFSKILSSYELSKLGLSLKKINDIQKLITESFIFIYDKILNDLKSFNLSTKKHNKLLNRIGENIFNISENNPSMPNYHMYNMFYLNELFNIIDMYNKYV